METYIVPRIDHIAYRVKDRHKAAEFFVECLDYRVVKEFQPKFSDGTNQGVNCLVLEPPEKRKDVPSRVYLNTKHDSWYQRPFPDTDYHIAPEIFISDGPPESIVGKWVAERNNIGGIHHLAYEVDDVQKVMDEWRAKGFAEFLTEEPIKCPGLEQVFTRPSDVTGVIIELIKRDKDGFCEESVAKLMESTVKD